MALVSVSVARSRLGVSAQSVRRFINEGKLAGEKSDTDRWMVEEGSLDALIASRKAQHPKGSTATPKATNVVKDSNIKAVKPAPKGDVSTAKFTQARDISRFRDIITPVLDDQKVTWLSAQDLTALFHNNLFEFGNAEKFVVELNEDWSVYLGKTFIESQEIGQLVRFDPDSIRVLLLSYSQRYADQIPSVVYRKRAQYELSEYSMPEVEAVVKYFVVISYGGVLVCRSAPQLVEVSLLAWPSDD